MLPAAPSTTTRRALLLIPFAVLLAIHPLLIHGPTCGQDLAFHIQSWLDAAQQLRHGVLYPHWDITAAWSAGEPRFLFYPPLSWLLGAILTLIFPIALCPAIFIAIALLLSGLTFHKLASQFASPNAALIASTLYLANPYMLFTAFERCALSELLAAAWIPLLLLAILRPRPSIRSIAIPLALLWLTNSPAAVIGSYALALLATLRVLHAIFTSPKLSSRPEFSIDRAPKTLSSRPEAAGRSGETCSSLAPRTSPSPFRLALTYLTGTALGLTLPAIYLLPAIYERRFIQVSMAIIPNLRYQDNFLFTPTADAAHNAVNHTISTLALTLLLLTATALLALLLTAKINSKRSTTKDSVILSEAQSAQPKDPEELPATHTSSPFSTNPLNPPPLIPTLAILTATIAFLLTPLSTPIWQHLPELAYLQFPWRLLILLTPILALAVALLLNTHNTHDKDTLPRTLKPSPSAQDPGAGAPGPDSRTWVRRVPNRLATALTLLLPTALTLLLPLALTVVAYRLYDQPCDPNDDPTHLAQLFATHHGFPPTDEYTPTPADNDPLRISNPAYWLAHSPNDPAPNTLPTAAELNPSLDTDDTDDTPIPPNQTLSTPAPHHLTLTLTQPSILVLNLRDYPNWRITRSTPAQPIQLLSPSAQDRRTDGLIAIALPTGPSTINITWHRTPDEQLGLILSALSLITLALTYRRKPSA